jgi:hypothetical protein
VAIALTAAIFGPPAAGSPARLTYRLVDSAGPQWYTPAFEQQVMASGTVGVRMPEGATFPGGITEQTLAAALRTGLGAGQWLLTLPGSDGSDGSDTTVGWCTASFLFRYNDRWGVKHGGTLRFGRSESQCFRRAAARIRSVAGRLRDR